MPARFLFAAIALLLPTCACGQTAPNTATAAADNLAVHRLLDQYAKAVDTVDLKLLAQIWSHSPDVSFIYPLGEEHGFDAIEHNVFEKVIGGVFSARDIKMHDVMIYVKGDSAWSGFRWDFHATLRKDGSGVTTHGVESQVYRRENGQWRLVHVHYSEDRQPAPLSPAKKLGRCVCGKTEDAPTNCLNPTRGRITLRHPPEM